jgi:hypothetical protein
MEEKIALVKFDAGSKRTYAYRTTILDLKKGNTVTVQINRGRGHKHAEFVEYTDDPEMDKMATALILSRLEVDMNTMNYNRSKKKEQIKKTMALIDAEKDEINKEKLKKILQRYLKEYSELI